MTSTIAKRGASKLLRCPNRSYRSLQPLTSVSSSESSFSASGSVPGLDRQGTAFPRFHRDLSNLSDLPASCPGSCEDCSSDINAKLIDRTSSLNRDVEQSRQYQLPLSNADRTILVQCVFIFTMALQIPNYLKVVLQLLEFHYERMPFLFLLGAVPSLLSKRSKCNHSTKSCSSAPLPCSTSATISSLKHHISMSSLAAIERFYSDEYHIESYAIEGSVHVLGDLIIDKTPQDQNPVDEWGHFTEIDETTEDFNQVYLMIPSTLRPCLGPLEEQDHEVDDDEEG